MSRNQEEPILKKTMSSSTTDSYNNDEYIGSFEAAPHYMQDNNHIHSGYRINFTSKRRLLKSLFMVHN